MKTIDDDCRAAFDALVATVEEWRNGGLRVVLCHGCFDPLHVGHLRHFKAARRHGDRLVVTVTPDPYVREQKGPSRPLVPQDLRLELIAELRVVDAAAINLWPSAAETLARLRPAVFAKGSDYRDAAHPFFQVEKELLRQWGGEVVFTDEWSTSSTQLIERLTGG